MEQQLEKRNWIKKAAVGTFAAAAMITGGSFAWATTAAPSTTTFNGCVSVLGVLRVVDTHASCLPIEKRITWNQTGPQGSAGPAGVAGPQGPAGPKGDGLVNIGGIVNSDGGIIGHTRGANFSVTRTSPGQYRITFPPNTFPGPAVMTLTPDGLPGAALQPVLLAQTADANGSYFDVGLTSTQPAFTAADGIFSFIVIA